VGVGLKEEAHIRVPNPLLFERLYDLAAALEVPITEILQDE
jgi:hypothetical protein